MEERLFCNGDCDVEIFMTLMHFMWKNVNQGLKKCILASSNITTKAAEQQEHDIHSFIWWVYSDRNVTRARGVILERYLTFVN